MKRNNNKSKVEFVEVSTLKATIYMDRGSGVFECEYGGEKFSSQDLQKVRDWAKDRIKKTADMQWHPVMKVNIDNEDRRVNNLEHFSNIECYIERIWIAWDGKQWLECRWVVDHYGTTMCAGPNNSDREQPEMPDEMLAMRRLDCSHEFHYAGKNPFIKWPLVSNSHRDKIYFVPYTEENWQTMVGVIERIREVRSTVNKMLSTSHGWAQLKAIASNRLLNAPKSQEPHEQQPAHLLAHADTESEASD
jgi:hypothetical protein